MARIAEITRQLRLVCRSVDNPDTGLDGEIQIVDRGEDQTHVVRGGILKFQSKSGSSYIKGDSENSFYTPVKEKHLRLWYESPFPVLFIVYHPDDDTLYFKHVQSYLRSKSGTFKPPYKIEFDKRSDRLEATESCRKHLTELAGHAPQVIDRSVKERLLTNLLPVVRPPRLWVAPCLHANRMAVKKHVHGTPPFYIADKMLYTVEDLSDSEAKLREVVDEGALEEVSNIFRWMDRSERASIYFNLLYSLLGAHCRKCGLEYDSDHKRNYFPRENDEDMNFSRRWFSIRTEKWSRQPRATVKYLEYGRDKFWRHLAARFQFRQFGSKWALRIVPGYQITKDGEEPYFDDRVGPLVTKQKSRERNLAVLNHVLFWSDVLAREAHEPRYDDRITFWLNSKPVMEIDRMPLWGIADFGIATDPAPFQQNGDQLLLFGSDQENNA